MDRRAIHALAVVLFALAGTLVLASLLDAKGPVEVTPGQVGGLELGTRVVVEGVVGGDTLRRGDTFTTFRLETGGEGIRVFAPCPLPDLGPGDRVRVAGRVDLYRGEVEVLAEDAEDVRVLSPGGGTGARLGELTGEPWRFCDGDVAVRVRVEGAALQGAGGRWWVLVGDPGDAGSVLAVAMMTERPEGEAWEPGSELDLRVAVRYHADRGLVYLEVLG